MLEDRDYMRQPEYHESRVSFTVALLIVNAAVFLVQMAGVKFRAAAEIEYNYFALSLAGLKNGFIWQLLTFQFMHSGLMHIIFNSLAIYFFGRPVETALGRRHFLTLYLSAESLAGWCKCFLRLVPVIWRRGCRRIGGRIWLGCRLRHPALGGTVQHADLFHSRDDDRENPACGEPRAGVPRDIDAQQRRRQRRAPRRILTGAYYVRLFIQGQWPGWKSPARRSAPREFAAKRAGKRRSGIPQQTNRPRIWTPTSF